MRIDLCAASVVDQQPTCSVIGVKGTVTLEHSAKPITIRFRGKQVLQDGRDIPDTTVEFAPQPKIDRRLIPEDEFALLLAKALDSQYRGLMLDEIKRLCG